MAVWPYLMTLSGVTVAASCVSGCRFAVRNSILILSGFVAARVLIHLPINSDMMDFLFCAMWGAIGGVIAIPATSHASHLVAKFSVLICALCSFWGRITNAHFEFGSPPYAIADTMLMVAMVALLWGERDRVSVNIGVAIDRISRLVNCASVNFGRFMYYNSRGSVENSQAVEKGRHG